jgi:hypothetical protein
VALDEELTARFRTSGYVVLERFFDAERLSAEVDRALAEGCLPDSNSGITGSAGNSFQYVPMMDARTPASLSLIDELADAAAELLARKVLPVRAKGTRYFGATGWHRDSDLDVASVGFLAYLDRLDAGTGALRVLPGSHRSRPEPEPEGTPGREDIGEAIETDPGDVIALDEHLYHASIGGLDRRQWRVDYVADRVGESEEECVRGYFAGIFPPDWDGRYDADLYPSYGSFWRSLNRPWLGRLDELGVYELAGIQESAMRARARPSAPG